MIKQIVITGGTRGIGRAVAERFAAEGFQLAVIARSQADLAAIEKDFRDRFPDCRLRTYVADLSQKEQVTECADRINRHFTDLAVLVNNAGLFEAGPLHQAAEGALEQTMAVNVYAPYYLTRALLPAMLRRQSGHIFNICSVASLQAYGDRGIYTISKHALLGFSRALRAELKQKGIKVTALLPGPTRTSSWDAEKLPPPGHLMPPEDVAAALYNAWDSGPHTVVEEILLRPMKGVI